MVTYRTIDQPAVSHADGRVTVRLDGVVYAFGAATADALGAALRDHARIVAAQDDVSADRIIGVGRR